MTEKEMDKLAEKGDELIKELVKTMHKHISESEFSEALVLYTTAKFAAGNLLTIQRHSEAPHLEDSFFSWVKQLMVELKQKIDNNEISMDDYDILN